MIQSKENTSHIQMLIIMLKKLKSDWLKNDALGYKGTKIVNQHYYVDSSRYYRRNSHMGVFSGKFTYFI